MNNGVGTQSGTWNTNRNVHWTYQDWLMNQSQMFFFPWYFCYKLTTVKYVSWHEQMCDLHRNIYSPAFLEKCSPTKAFSHNFFLNIHFNLETISLAERRDPIQGCSNYTTNGPVAAGFCYNWSNTGSFADQLSEDAQPSWLNESTPVYSCLVGTKTRGPLWSSVDIPALEPELGKSKKKKLSFLQELTLSITSQSTTSELDSP